MKKILAIILASLMLIAVVGCGNNNTETEAPETDTPVTDAPETEAPSLEVIEPTVEENSWGAAFWADFKTAVDTGLTTAEEIANAVLSSESGMALNGGMAGPAMEGYLQGFSDEITGFKSGAMFAPMAAGYAFMGYVFELEEGADVASFVDTLNTNADLRWMICMTAEAATIGAYGNYVLAVLSPIPMPGGATEAVVIEPAVEEGSNAEALWNTFSEHMAEFGAMALAEDIAYGIAMSPAFTYENYEITAIETEITPAGFAFAIEGFDNGASIVSGDFAAYIFQIEPGMMADSWGGYYFGANAPEDAQFVWGAYDNTLILMLNTEIAE